MNFIIQISYNGGSTWITIATNIPSINKVYEYILLNNIETENALIKIINANNPSQYVISDIFSILNDIPSIFNYEIINKPRKIYHDITHEIWRRILNNLPYIFKSKGTLRSLKSLITIYGIPESILQIREFGGPDLKSTNLENIEEYEFESFGSALNFYGNQYIKIPWTNQYTYNLFPSAVQIRFLTKNNINNVQCLVSVDNKWAITLNRDTNNPLLGDIRFITSNGLILSSSKLPLYDDNPVLVTLQRSVVSDANINQIFNLYVKKYDGNSIISSHTFINTTPAQNSIWKQTGNLYIGGTLYTSFGNNFNGSIDEFRLWNSSLYEYVIDTHTKFPQSIIGNNIYSFYNDLLVQFNFNNPIHPTDIIKNNAPSNIYDVANLEMSGWPLLPIFPYHYRFIYYKSAARSLNIGLNRFTSNKVRIERTQLVKNLSPFEFAEEGEFDFAPIDLNKIGIYFSPIDLINEDIIKKLAINSGDDLIGDPRDQYNDYYKNLNQLNNTFWKFNFSNITLTDYFKFIKFYDFSLFEQLKNLIPARCFPIFGILYGPTLLQRNKVKKYKPHVNSNTTGNEFINLIPKILFDFILFNIFFKNNDIYNINGNNFDQLLFIIDYNKNNNIIANNFEQTESILNYYKNFIFNFEITNNYNTQIDIKSNYKLNSINFSNYITDKIINIYNINKFVGSIDLQINPLVDFETLNNKNDNINLPIFQFRFAKSAGLNEKYYYSRNCYESWEQNIKYIGCKQTEKTTLDNKSPIEIWNSNPNKLVVREINDLKLDVI